jgi:hypothetical protein
MNAKHILWVIITAAILVQGVIAADTTTLDPGTSTDWTLWIISGMIGLFLFLMSLNTATSSAEVEIDAIISVMAWIPIAFCAYASFNISRVVSAGTVTLYSQGTIGMLMAAFLAVAIFNTIRIVVLHKVLRGEPEQERDVQND